MSYVYKSAKLKIDASLDRERVVKGYASFFGNVDSYNDTIKPGAFKRTIKAQGPDGRDMVKLCAQHDMDRPIAKIIKLEENAEGLYMEAKFGTHRDGEDFYRMTKEGILNEFSVGFLPIQESENEMGGRDFEEIKLYEISMVTVAANDKAVVTDIKSDPLKLIKQVENDELAFKLEREFHKLSSNVDEASTQPADDAPDPEVDKEDKYNQFLTGLHEASKHLTFNNGK